MRVWDQTHLHLSVTESGRVLLQGTACILLAAMVMPAFGVLAALATVLVTALIAGFILRPRIRVRSDMPESVIAGQTAQLHYQLENVARVSAYQLSVEIDPWPASIERFERSRLIPRLAPGETVDISLGFKAQRRGRFVIPSPVCRSGFPFNMFVFGLSQEDRQSLLVLPPIFPLRLLTQDYTWRSQSSGTGLAGRTEVSPEYAGNRPFVAGDSPRHIDVRAWARLSVPATKEYYTDEERLALLVLDNRVRGPVMKNSNPSECFEAAVCLCASAAFELDRDCSIDAILIGSTLHRLSRMPKAARFGHVHEMLATVEPSGDQDLESVGQEMKDHWRDLSEVVFIVTAWDRTYSTLIEEATLAGCHTTVLLVSGDAVDVNGHSPRQVPLQTRCDLAVLSPHDVLEGRMGDL
jgi:uncharacterized protein (DUF58 family)